MAGVSYSLESRGLDEALRGLARVSSHVAERRGRLSAAAGAVMESSTKRRIADEKTAPDGGAWPGWSEAHGASRKTGQSLLHADGDLMDSIQALSSPNEAQVGSNLVYAAIHQFGGEDVGKPALPARPWLGLGARDKTAIETLLSDFMGGLWT